MLSNHANGIIHIPLHARLLLKEQILRISFFRRLLGEIRRGGIVEKLGYEYKEGSVGGTWEEPLEGRNPGKKVVSFLELL